MPWAVAWPLPYRLVNALLRQFVALIETDRAAGEFVRRGPVFRYFDVAGDGIAIDLQRTVALEAEVEFFVNVGVLLAPHLRYYLGEDDPHRTAMPHHSVWRHRLVATAEEDRELSAKARAARLADPLRKAGRFRTGASARGTASTRCRRRTGPARRPSTASGHHRSGCAGRDHGRAPRTGIAAM